MSPSVLLLFSVESGSTAAELLEVGLADDVEMWRGSETPPRCLSLAVCPVGSVAGCSGDIRSGNMDSVLQNFLKKPVLIVASLSTCSFI